MFKEARVFNQDIGNWDLSLNTRQVSMFEKAYVFHQDITGWSTTRQQTTSRGDVRRRHPRGSPESSGASTEIQELPSSGPASEWVHKPCLVNERVLSGWCVPCGGGGIRPAGDDPSSGDTMCAFPDTAALKAAVDRCLNATNGGAERRGVLLDGRELRGSELGAVRGAGCVEMPEWDVSLVTDMEGLFRDKARVQRGYLGVGYLAGDGHVWHVL